MMNLKKSLFLDYFNARKTQSLTRHLNLELILNSLEKL